MSEKSQLQEFQELANSWIDGRATEAQTLLLEQMASSSPEMMRHFVELSLLNASLAYIGDLSPASPRPLTIDGPANGENRFQGWFWPVNTASALAALFLVAMFVFAIMWRTAPATKTFARLDTKAGARWVSASVPTDTGSQIGCGRLKLAAGLVSIQFEIGALLELEGPADFEILNPTRCRLNSGKLLATVHSNFKGFVVETPNAILTDQGTSFCVSVQTDGESKMQVLDGRVDVADRRTGVEKKVFGNSSVRLTLGGISDSFDVEQGSTEKPSLSSTEKTVVYLSTLLGRGTDFWVQRDDLKPGSEVPKSAPILLVKWSMNEYRRYDRKAYLRFDLTGVSRNNLSTAALTLNAVPSGLGFASMTIDSTFAIYGVTEDNLDVAPSGSVWNDAPASTQSGGTVNLSYAQLLGKFVIPQGVQEGTFSIQSPELVSYLTNDRNRIATMIVVCETQSVASASIVFGFAASKNSQHSPPNLRLEYDK